jgi:Ca-activated chloride channel family protein
LHGGWLKGAETLAPLTSNEYVCRVILLSDGQANEGLTSEIQIAAQVKDLALAGVTTTTVGIGEGFNESLMTKMANAGQGNAWYGQRVEDLKESFDAEINYLSHIVWKNVRVGISGNVSSIKVHNDYVKNELNQYCLPSIALGAEVWLAASIPMREVLMLQELGQNITFNIRAMDAEDIEHAMTVELPRLEVVSRSEYERATSHEMVAQRYQEIEIADIQKEINHYVELRDWARVDRMMRDLKERAKDNLWLENSIKYIQRLVDQRDFQSTSKELQYSMRVMKNRLTERDEGMFLNMSFEEDKPEFLRRKSAQGRNSQSQDE